MNPDEIPSPWRWDLFYQQQQNCLNITQEKKKKKIAVFTRQRVDITLIMHDAYRLKNGEKLI